MTPRADDGWAVGLIAVALILTYGAYQAWLNLRRVRDLEKFLFAGNFGPSTDPDWRSFRESEPRITKLERRLRGNLCGNRAMIEDFRIGAGKGSYSQTFVAVERADEETFRTVPLISALSLKYRQSGRWLVGTVTKQTLGADAIEGYLRCFT